MFPVAKGDIVLLVFADRCIDTWFTNGNDSDPKELRQHHISDAIAIPGLRDSTRALADAPASGGKSLIIGKAGGAQLELGDTSVAKEALALAKKVNDDFKSVKSDFDNHMHQAGTALIAPAGVIAAPCTGVTSTPVTPLSTPTDVSSQDANVSG